MRFNRVLTYHLPLIIALIALVVLPSCSTGQSKIITIGVVNLAQVLDPVFQGFKDGMQEMGYVEGQDIRYVYPGPAGSIDALKPVVDGFVKSNVDLILALGTPATQAAQAATTNTNMRVIFAALTDPLGAKVVTQFRRPGGNITGIRHGVNEAKRLEWLVKIAPGTTRIYVPYNPDDAAAVRGLELISGAAEQLHVELVKRPGRNTAEIVAAIENIPPDVNALFLLADNLVASQLDKLVAASLAHKLPLSAPNGPQAEAGALIAYGFDFRTLGKQAARLSDQVLKGVSPGDLPVETAEFFLTINLQTAQAIGLNIPDKFLRQADKIIRPASVTPTDKTF